jgi:hypothetical protein
MARAHLTDFVARASGPFWRNARNQDAERPLTGRPVNQRQRKDLTAPHLS